MRRDRGINIWCGAIFRRLWMEGLESPAENVGLTTWTLKLREQNGLRKNSGFYLYFETKIMRNGATSPKNWWVEQTMLWKITGILASRKELIPCNMLLTSILKERRGKRYKQCYLKTWTTSLKLKIQKQKLRTFKNFFQSFHPNKWKSWITTWTESSLSIFKRS